MRQRPLVCSSRRRASRPRGRGSRNAPRIVGYAEASSFSPKSSRAAGGCRRRCSCAAPCRCPSRGPGGGQTSSSSSDRRESAWAVRSDRPRPARNGKSPGKPDCSKRRIFPSARGSPTASGRGHGLLSVRQPVAAEAAECRRPASAPGQVCAVHPHPDMPAGKSPRRGLCTVSQNSPRFAAIAAPPTPIASACSDAMP